MGAELTKPGRDYPPRPIVGVGAVIFQGDRVLLVKRGHEPSAGLWSIPGGAVRLGETLSRALRREVAEEAGLKVRLGPLVAVCERIFRDQAGRIQYHYILLDYLCHAVSGRPAAASDAAGLCLASPAELRRLRLTRGTRAVIEKARRLREEGPCGQRQAGSAPPTDI